jgi:hypothetical protein
LIQDIVALLPTSKISVKRTNGFQEKISYENSRIFKPQYLENFIKRSKYQRMGEASYSLSPLPCEIAICNNRLDQSQGLLYEIMWRYEHIYFKKDIQKLVCVQLLGLANTRRDCRKSVLLMRYQGETVCKWQK